MSSFRTKTFVDDERLAARQLRLKGPKTAVYMAQGGGRADHLIATAPKSLLQKYSFLARQKLSGEMDGGRLVLAQGSATEDGVIEVLDWMRRSCETEETRFLTYEAEFTARLSFLPVIELYRASLALKVLRSLNHVKQQLQHDLLGRRPVTVLECKTIWDNFGDNPQENGLIDRMVNQLVFFARKDGMSLENVVEATEWEAVVSFAEGAGREKFMEKLKAKEGKFDGEN
ncbi:hypothetical protein H2199_007465 [Coniosporium tulheliwenetii]|uniref:Uncharacterized protein n=1 Tax=Coniosporium tulheliwenetii TaxID=3383036 RepID=A0ACC2YPX2_9PEZI|nr:hypothetical protein H2199_007465 [Cladosporium sp. JES 115]